MPVLLNLFVNILFGWAAVHVTRRNEDLRDNLFGWSLLAIVIAESIFVTPLAAYTFRFYPHWSAHYLFDPDIYPQLHYWAVPLSAAVVFANFLVLVCSFALTRALLIHGHTIKLWVIGVLSAAAIIADIIFFWPRFLRLADYPLFWEGGGRLIFSHPIFLLGLLVYGLLGLTIYVMYRRLGQPGT